VKYNLGHRGVGRTIFATLVAANVLGALGAAHIARAQTVDPVVFSFATVGDNRQDPKKPDPTTFVENPSPTTQGGIYSQSGAVLPQDQFFLQNSAAWSEIQEGITAQGAQLLLFNGDMIYGYGRPIMPPGWTGNPSSWYAPVTATVLSGLPGGELYPDGFFEYLEYAYWRGSVSTLFNNGTYVVPVPGNHETECSATANPYSGKSGAPSSNPNCSTSINGGKQAWPENEAAFRANMGDLIQDLISNVRFSNVSGVFATNVVGTTAATAVPTSAAISTTTYCALGVTSTSGSPCVYSGGTPANNGPINDIQTDLDYSFDILVPGTTILLHFAVVNTDPSGSDETAPSDWLAGDFAAAAARAAGGEATKRRGKSNATPAYTIKYFVFGHKPYSTYNYEAAQVAAGVPGATNVAPGGLDANTSTSPNYQNLFWAVIAQYGATYFCGHEHIPHVQQYPDPTGVSTNTPFQVLVGSGGSPFDDTMDGTAPNATEPTPFTAPTDRYYAWALVQVHASGAVTLHMSGFPDTGIGGSVYDMTNYDVPGAVFTGNLQ
jgi:hypothetical protein